MSIIYFITTQDIDTFQKKLQETLFNAVTMPFPLLFDKRYAALINTAYLKLTLPAECLTPEFYRYLRELSLQWQFDFFIKPQPLPANGIIAFDMDSTFIAEEGVDEIARELGMSTQITAITQQAMEGKLDFNASFTRRIGMLKGTPKAVLNAVCDRMTLSPGLLTILPVIKAKGFKTAIISGGLDIFTQRLKERYQLDYAFSNTVEIRDNVLTDNITLPIMNAANKKQTLVDLAARLNIATENIIACGDGANDLPMLEHAGTGIAWKAKP
ncbi:phosphoserine phosphatase SerB, partial [Salmonella enterica subsp. enterica serovar 4,[5],12:i:-]|nr:phosphoserine phosphatase SerB [Salmonella enterica subsp. enterica serovar 4,[5],12:i:-]EDJ4252197.1 phosphoserine phosphatase SerB [Salmonella enterica subsp. enterica serovar Newport]EDX7523262.1 phosphoserine phosphatase SerB [Salmonella enterica subsp. enterica serovar 4,[5],12:i:-]EHL9396996.1 phosphoserine phosphatase SerB [Salmonella enterica subsp. enterica serovar Newport]HCH7510358.1 phosphoserine phosphatase SerB [Salmonella enterica]